MRQIYLLVSEADTAAASEIEGLLKQRGYQVRRADEKFGYPPARPQEITLALWSRSIEMSAKQILFTNRAIDAWTEGRLIFARLDHAMLPRGLGDVEAIDLSFAPGRVAAVWKIVDAAQEIDKAILARRGEGGGSAPEPEEMDEEERAPPRRKARVRRTFSAAPALIVGLVAAAAFMSLGFLAMPASSNTMVAAAALAWGSVAGAVAGYLGGGRVVMERAAAPKRARASMPAPAAPPAESAIAESDSELFASDPSAPVFVSYSRRDGEVVYPMVAEVEAAGRSVWIDRDEIHAGGNWAGMIVRAIRDSDTFCLMCSAEAFQSDNVRREIYIADKYKRKLLPVRLDFAEMPEDFEYFLIDRQWLDLTTADPVERAARLAAALAR
ncbi:MAG: toll/interleukin-1 receptor domain-containing protein [Hyphomonas sp.]|uniref:toll/interleukin-1 receptor domain-containing protein n=1 Tax=Hyphomonas sp. TaxID=87 RepID=UPI0017EF115D|nr:toll/interleukin-1 receptor domain-containing protein [Hyphomonas sp.]MBA3067220.1 toll/interleukin-1 receptor domain-containing protein [Hyphomonas sp.]MBU4061170.1 toll/interleukin-1 receptor domain-containing protein [Alphaproteobacteria bacterium]MBU4165082.1 toll/interleukin-1 receptor domain-containing protein [Alphaproteobacteria bacterium]MBU4567342.1 toll/interleukin-1 receptor domain-containing protein [Alphaproteobacteria bacterium]